MSFELIYFLVLYLLWIYVVYRNVKGAVLMLPLFFPLYLVRFDIYGLPIYFVEGLILIAAVPVFVKILKGEDENLMKSSVFDKVFYVFSNYFRKKEHPVKSYLKSPLAPIVFFLIACFISLLVAPGDSAKHALGILKSWVVIPIIFFVLVRYTVRSSHDVLFIMYSYIASTVVLGFWGLFQAITGTAGTIDARPSGPFESANYLVMYIAPAFIYLSVSFIQSFLHERVETANVRWSLIEQKVYLGPVIALLFLVLVLSQSYAGIVGVFGTLFIYLFSEVFRVQKIKSKRFLGKLLGFIATLLVIGSVIAVSLNYEKFQNLAKPDEHTSIGTRIEIWKVAGHLIGENPLLGIGLGEYQSSYVLRAEEILGKLPFEEKRLHSHNLYMETWLNTGLLGLISFFWLVVLAFARLKREMSFDERNILLGVLFMLAYFLVHGLVDTTFWKNDLALVYFLIMGVVFSFPLRVHAVKLSN